ncbi:MAG: hypothetical protein U0703_14060 [Anaerolineae bacterium]
MLETVGRLAAQVAPGIEDRWLLESGWLTQQVRECLRNLQDDVFLNHCPLADWLPVNDLIRRSEIVRQILATADGSRCRRRRIRANGRQGAIRY